MQILYFSFANIISETIKLADRTQTCKGLYFVPFATTTLYSD